MAEWQPIETAPKDGTPVDLWIVGSDNNVDFYSQTARKVKGKPLRAGRSPDWVWHHKSPNKPNWYPLGGIAGFPLMPGIEATHWRAITSPTPTT
jgi:hypothetical protein